VWKRSTTRCCSAVALTLASSLACSAFGARAAGQTRQLHKPPGHSSKPDSTSLTFLPATTLWTLALNNALTAPPAFEAHYAFFPIEGKRIVAYDLARGSRLWMTSAAPVMAAAASPDLLFIVENDALAALHVTDASTAWRLPFAEKLAAPPAWDNGWLVVSTIDGSVLAFSGADGTLVWRQEVGSPAHAHPSLAADRVYIPTEDGRVVALRVDTGTPIWEHRLGGAAGDILALDERLYVGSKDNSLYCLKAEDGEEAWHWVTGGDVIGLPVVDERSVYFVSLDNVLRALNRNSGNQRWKRGLPLRPTTGPVKAAQTLLIRGLTDKLPGYKVEDGTPAGDAAAGGEVAAPLHVTTIPGTYGPVVIIVTQDIVKGATVTALATSLEPPLATTIPVLANPVTFTRTAQPPAIPKP
jgi:outer membrane protein assembly factor BamB